MPERVSFQSDIQIFQPEVTSFGKASPSIVRSVRVVVGSRFLSPILIDVAPAASPSLMGKGDGARGGTIAQRQFKYLILRLASLALIGVTGEPAGECGAGFRHL